MVGKKTQVIAEAQQLLIDLVNKSQSSREFARYIGEDPADVQRWRTGKLKIHPRAVVTICRLFGTEPELLRPDLFTDVSFIFKKGNKK